MIRRAPFLWAAALVAVASACDRGGAEAARAVRAYDEELVRTFRTGDAARLREVALEKEAHRVQVLLELKKMYGLVMESELQAFEVSGARREGQAMTVETRERWRYHDRPVAPGRSPGPRVVADMRMRYVLEREEGAWKVRDVETLSTDYLEPAGGPPGRTSGHAAAPR